MTGLRMWATGLAIGSVCVALHAMPLAAAGDARKSGIYVESPGAAAPAEAKRLDGNMPKVDAQVGAAAAFGFGRPKVTTRLSGEKATTRAAADATFVFVFSGQTDMRTMMNDPSGAMGMMSELPGHTSSPKDYALIRMAVVEGDRAWDSKKGEQVKCVVEKMEGKVFRVKPEQALPPGEYAFALMTQGTAGMIWDFGVDATAPQ